MTIEIVKGGDTAVTKFFSASTPEADTFFLKRGMWNDEILAFCRKLERERDEMQNKMADVLQEVDLRTLDFERMRQERDEAREKYDNLASEHMLAINKLCNERDELREFSKNSSRGINKTVRLNQFLLSELIAVRKERDQIKEIASEFAITASHCLGWHENKNPNQITSALRRWLKLSTNELDA